MVFVEFKKSGEPPTALQEFEQRRLRDMGFIAVIIDNIEQGEEFFEGLEADELRFGMW